MGWLAGWLAGRLALPSISYDLLLFLVWLSCLAVLSGWLADWLWELPWLAASPADTGGWLPWLAGGEPPSKPSRQSADLKKIERIS